MYEVAKIPLNEGPHVYEAFGRRPATQAASLNDANFTNRRTASIKLSKRKDQVVALLKSIETADPAPRASINPEKYIQHNLAIADGLAGVSTMLDSLPKGSSKVNTIRVFEDGDFVFTHSEYEFFGPKVGFDIFRFENELIVEHWDNLQETSSKSTHTMIDGPVAATDLGRTQANKELLCAYMDDIFVNKRTERFPTYFDGNNYIQHNPFIPEDGLAGLFAGLAALAQKGINVEYRGVKMILGEGDFVLVVNDGAFGGEPTAIYDLYRVQDGKIAEHWDTLEAIPPTSEWKNRNGKF